MEDPHRHTLPLIGILSEILLGQREMHVPITFGTVTDSLNDGGLQAIPLLGTLEAELTGNLDVGVPA